MKSREGIRIQAAIIGASSRPPEDPCSAAESPLESKDISRF